MDIFSIFKKKEKIKPSCATCKHYEKIDVLDNRMVPMTLGLCNNPDVRKECISFGRNDGGFHLSSWPANMPHAPISFSPEFSCKHYKTKE